MNATQLRLGPADLGRPLSLDEYESADYAPGFKYGIIDGRLYVAPVANLPENWLERWLTRKLERYAEDPPVCHRLCDRESPGVRPRAGESDRTLTGPGRVPGHSPERPDRRSPVGRTSARF